jgi:hypothetical protein
MLGILIATVLAVAALVWIVLYVVREQLKEREQVDKELHGDETPTLEYAVPEGQDPAVVLAALERAGYTATVDPNGPHQVVLIACPAGVDRDRAHVRSVIESGSVTAPQDGVPMQVDVRFRDEK